MAETRSKLSWIWMAALGCFVIAGATGSLMRFGLLNGLPAGLFLVNVRHAHSHLMYFGWVTPALMALIVAWLPKVTGRQPSRRFLWVMGATIAAALLAYVMFIQYGYQSAEIDGRRLPLSVFAATLNVLAWYAFAYLYYRATKGVTRNRPLGAGSSRLGFAGTGYHRVWHVGCLDYPPMAGGTRSDGGCGIGVNAKFNTLAFNHWS